MGYNKTIVEGHLTRDIEIKYTQAGSAIANTAIAVSRKFKSAAGEQKEEVLFIDLAFFGRTAEIANQFLRKGSHVLIDGRLKLDQWTAQDGSKRSKHSITVENLQMLGSKDQQPGQPASQPQGGAYAQPQPGTPPPAYNQPGQPAPQSQPGAQPTYNHPGQPGYAPQGQPAPQPATGAQPVGKAPNGAPIYSQPAQGQPSPGQHNPAAPHGYGPNGQPNIDINEDEIPF